MALVCVGLFWFWLVRDTGYHYVVCRLTDDLDLGVYVDESGESFICRGYGYG